MRAWGFAGLLLLFGCGSSGSGAGIGGAAGAGGSGGSGGFGGTGGGNVTLADGPCGALAYGQIPGVTVHCSVLDVPADWRAPDAPERFRLPVMRFVPQGGGSGLPAIALLGGPGDESDSFTGDVLVDTVNQLGHELVYFDQRGAGRADPSPRCTELAGVDVTDPAAGVAALGECRARLEGEGVDLSVFNTFQSAHDVNALAGALGYGQVALVGFSYGTRLALAAARDFPDRVGALVLDSVTPPHLFALEELGVGIDGAVNALIAASGDPTLDGKLDATLAALPVPWSAGPGGQLTKEAFAAALVTILGRDPDAIDDAPAFIELAHGDVTGGSVSASLSSALSQALGGAGGIYDVAMFFSTTCTDNQHASPARAAERNATTRPGLQPYFSYTSDLGFSMCTNWPKQTEPAERFAPLTSSVPALVLTARFDAITPPSWAAETAGLLPAATLVQITRAAHLTVYTDESLCAPALVKTFLDAPGAPLSTTCAN